MIYLTLSMQRCTSWNWGYVHVHGSGIVRGGAIKAGGAGMLHGLLLTEEWKYAEQDEQKK